MPRPPMSTTWQVLANIATILPRRKVGVTKVKSCRWPVPFHGSLVRKMSPSFMVWAGNFAEEVADGAGHRVDVAGRAGHRLGQHVALEVEHAGREVARLARRGREAGADQGQRLLLDDRDQAVPHQLQADGREGIVEAHGYTFSIRMAPIGLILAAKLLGTMVVVSSSAMTAGPGTKLPIERSARW